MNCDCWICGDSYEPEDGHNTTLGFACRRCLHAAQQMMDRGELSPVLAYRVWLRCSQLAGGFLLGMLAGAWWLPLEVQRAQTISLADQLRPTHALIDHLRRDTRVPLKRREMPFTA